MQVHPVHPADASSKQYSVMHKGRDPLRGLPCIRCSQMGGSKTDDETVLDAGLARLRKGQRWLDEQFSLWLADDDSGVSDDLFMKMLDEWDRLERELRSLWALEGCVNEIGCPDDGVVRCLECASARLALRGAA